MIIDKEQLISLLKEKTGLERQQVENQLSQLINKIQEAAEEGKTFEIEGFGTFDMQEDNLQFEPSDTLETEINNKYAGMKPIELIGAFKEPEGDEIPEVDEETGDEDRRTWAFDHEAEDEGKSEEESAVEFTRQQAGQEEIEAGDDEQPDIPETETGEDVEEVFASAEKETEPVEYPQEEPLQVKKDDSETVIEGDEEQDPIGKLLVAAVIVIALGVGGWLVYDTGLIDGVVSDGSNQQVAEQSTQGPAARQSGDSQENTPDTPSETSQQNEEDSEPEQQTEVGKQQEAPSTGEPQFGLRGEVDQSITGGYTIVVHSLTSMRKAENEQQALQEAGFRALIMQAEIGGVMRYRVGIGQFQTVDAAQQAVSEIPEPFQSNQNHFIKRIQ